MGRAATGIARLIATVNPDVQRSTCLSLLFSTEVSPLAAEAATSGSSIVAMGNTIKPGRKTTGIAMPDKRPKSTAASLLSQPAINSLRGITMASTVLDMDDTKPTAVSGRETESSSDTIVKLD